MTTDQTPTTPEQTPPAAIPTPSAVAPKTEPRPKTPPFDAAARVVQVVQLASIHFSACSAQALEAADAIPEDVNFSASTRFLTPGVTLLDDGFATTTTLLFQVGGKMPDAEAPPKPYAVIRATIEAKYNLKPESPKFSDDDLKDYALCYCPFHVWGYWREFVQSSLARLDLPQITVPLFLIAQAPQMVQDKLE
jgi:hypothetical protein